MFAIWWRGLGHVSLSEEALEHFYCFRHCIALRFVYIFCLRHGKRKFRKHCDGKDDACSWSMEFLHTNDPSSVRCTLETRRVMKMNLFFIQLAT